MAASLVAQVAQVPPWCQHHDVEILELQQHTSNGDFSGDGIKAPEESDSLKKWMEDTMQGYSRFLFWLHKPKKSSLAKEKFTYHV